MATTTAVIDLEAVAKREAAKTRLARTIARLRPILGQLTGGTQIPHPAIPARDPGPWIVEDAADAHCHLKTKTLAAPTRELPYAGSIRIEELLHARYSVGLDGAPASQFLEKARYRFIQVAEDYRVHAIGMTMPSLANNKNFIKGAKQINLVDRFSILATEPKTMSLTGSLASRYPLEAILCAMAHRWPVIADNGWFWIDCLDMYFELYEVPLADTCAIREFVSEVIWILDDEVSAPPTTLLQDKPYPNFTKALAEQFEVLMQKYEIAVLDDRKGKEKGAVRSPSPIIEVDPSLAALGLTVADMLAEDEKVTTVYTPSLDRRLLFREFSRTVGTDGPLLFRIENLPIDPLRPPIFAGRKRNPNLPVILLDVSGSMGVAVETIMNLTQSVPGCTVLMHSANKHGGHLCIVSDKGRMCSADAFHLHKQGGNGSDFGAIHYCVTHYPGRHIHWVTDRGFSFKENKASQSILTSATVAYAKSNHTTIHDNISQFLLCYHHKKKAAA